MKAKEAALHCFNLAASNNSYQAKMVAHNYLEDSYEKLDSIEKALFYKIADSSPQNVMTVCSHTVIFYNARKESLLENLL